MKSQLITSCSFYTEFTLSIICIWVTMTYIAPGTNMIENISVKSWAITTISYYVVDMSSNLIWYWRTIRFNLISSKLILG